MAGTVREYLSKTEDVQIRTKVIDIIAKRLVGRKIMPTWNVGDAAQEVGYDKVIGDMAAAELISKGGLFPRNVITEGRTTIAIPKLGEGFDIPREDILTSRKLGTPLNTRFAAAAGRKIAEKEDAIIINGWSAWALTGLLTSPGNTQEATAVWSDVSNNTAFEDVNQSIGKIEAKGLEGRAFIVHPTNYAEARGNVLSNTDVSKLSKIAELFPGGMNAILKSDTIPEGTGLVVDTSEDVSQLVIAEEIQSENEYKMERQAYQYNVWERVIPLIYDTNGQCSITGI